MKIIKKTIMLRVPVTIKGTTKRAMREALAEVRSSLFVSVDTIGTQGTTISRAYAKTGRVTTLREEKQK